MTPECPFSYWCVDKPVEADETYGGDARKGSFLTFYKLGADLTAFFSTKLNGIF